MSQHLETEFGGRTLTIETGRLARLAGGAVTVRYGDTLVLGTANRSDPRPGLDFFPLTVEFEERMYAAGKIPGGFIKREARASEAATLAARLTDRPIRPLFPEGYKDDIQLVITVLSTDQENEPDVIGTVAASAALTISEIPFHGPVGAVRIGRIDGEFVVNPTFSQLAESELDLVVSGTRDAIMMVEAGAKLLPEAVMAEAILFGHRALQPLIDIQEELQKAVGKAKSHAVPRGRHRASVLDFAEGGRRGRRVRRRRRRDDRHAMPRWPTSSRSPRSRSRAARSPTAGRRSSTRAARSSATRCTASPTPTSRRPRSRPRPPGRRSSSSATRSSSGTASASTSAFLEAALADGTHVEQGRYLDTLTIAREGYPDLENYKLADAVAASSASSSPRRIGPLPDAEATANLLIWFGNDLPGRIAALRAGHRRRRSGRRGPAATAKAIQEAARREARVSKSLFSLVNKKTARQLALDEGIRMDGRGLTELRPISVEVGLLPRAHGSGLFTRGETQVLTIATLGASSDVQRIDTISPEDREALHPPLQLPALLDGREQADARPEPPRHRSRQPRRAGAHPGPAATTTSSRTSSGSCRSACRPTARPRWPRPAARPSP